MVVYSVERLYLRFLPFANEDIRGYQLVLTFFVWKLNKGEREEFKDTTG